MLCLEWGLNVQSAPSAASGFSTLQKGEHQSPASDFRTASGFHGRKALHCMQAGTEDHFVLALDGWRTDGGQQIFNAPLQQGPLKGPASSLMFSPIVSIEFQGTFFLFYSSQLPNERHRRPVLLEHPMPGQLCQRWCPIRI